LYILGYCGYGLVLNELEHFIAQLKEYFNGVEIVTRSETENELVW